MFPPEMLAQANRLRSAGRPVIIETPTHYVRVGETPMTSSRAPALA